MRRRRAPAANPPVRKVAHPTPPKLAKTAWQTVARHAASEADPLLGDLPEHFPAQAVHWQSVRRLPADAVLVPLYANGASMGSGTEELHEDVMLGHITLSGTWVQRYARPTSAAALRFLHAYGDSMTPTFSDGDVLLVDPQTTLLAPLLVRLLVERSPSLQTLWARARLEELVLADALLP